MELADVERLFTIPAGPVARLRASLRAAGLDERFVAKIARVGERLDEPLRAPMRSWHARRSSEPAAVLARLFLLRDPVPTRDAERVLGDLTALADGGLLERAGDRVTSRLHLALAGDFLIFGDPSAAADAVPPLNAVTALLARASMPRRSVERALDLGCGAGALALCLAAVARHVVATDVNPRALAWARFNARVNEVGGVDFRLGDLFEPARDDRFDLVVSQPPFVARRADAPPSAFAHGGDRGDELALRAVAGAASRLTLRGRAVVLADWPLFDGPSLAERVSDALGAAPVDALVLQSPGKNLDEYCTSIAAAEHPHLGDAFARAACAQRDHFEALGARGVAQALVVLEASGTGRTALVSVRHGNDAPITSETVDRIAAAHALASGPDRPLLEARLRMPVGTRLVEQPSAHGVGPAVTRSRTHRRTTRGRPVRRGGRAADDGRARRVAAGGARSDRPGGRSVLRLSDKNEVRREPIDRLTSGGWVCRQAQSRGRPGPAPTGRHSMAKLVVKGAQLMCSMGTSPAALSVLPPNMTTGDDNDAANIQDMQPNVNIAPFGMCQSPSNPQVAAATAAAMGVLTPQPCMPMTVAPWTPGSTSVTIGGQPAVSDSCQLACTWGGQIQVQSAGQTDIDVD